MATLTNRLLVLEANGEISRNNTADTLEIGSSLRTVGSGTFAFDSTGALTASGPASISLTPSGALTLTGGAASTWSTSVGSLTITSAAASTWSTAAGDLSLAGAAGLNLDSNAGNLEINATGGVINIGNDADNQNINIGTGGTRTITLGSGNAPVAIAGDLVVSGTVVTKDAETVLIADNHLYLNSGYETNAAQTGGLVVNYLPTATATSVAATGFVAGVASTSNPTVITLGSAIFAANDFIQIAGASNPSNNGLFEVLSHVGTTLTIRGIGTTATVQDFSQNQFVTDTTVAGTIRKVTISVMRAGTDGIWEVASGSTNSLTFSDLATSSGSTLQSAYDSGQTIALSNAKGNLVITTDETGTVADFQVAREGSGFYFQTDAANDTAIVGSSAVLVAVDVIDNSAGAFQVKEGATVYVDLSTLNAAEVLTLGEDVSGASATTLQSGSGGVTVLLPDDVAVAGRVAQGEFNYLVFDTTDGSEAVTLGAGGVINAVVNINSGTGTLNIGSTASARSVNVGTGAAAQAVTVGSTTSTSALTVQAGTGAMTFTAGGVFDVNATGAVTIDGPGISIDGTSASNLSVTGANLSIETLTSGTLAVSSAGALNLSSTTGDWQASGALTLDSSGGAISIGGDADAQAINIGTGAAARTITIGNGTGATALALNSGTGNIDIGTNAVAHTIAIGNATGASAVTIDSGTGRTVLDTTSVASNAIELQAGNTTFLALDNRAVANDVPGQRLDVALYASFGANGAGIVATVGEAVSVGNILTLKVGVASNQFFKSDADAAGLKTVSGVAMQASTGSGNSVKIHTLPGVVIPIVMDASTTSSADEGKVVYLSTTAGVGTLTAPTGSGSVVFRLGLLQSAGASTTQSILFMPQFIANNP